MHSSIGCCQEFFFSFTNGVKKWICVEEKREWSQLKDQRQAARRRSRNAEDGRKIVDVFSFFGLWEVHYSLHPVMKHCIGSNFRAVETKIETLLFSLRWLDFADSMVFLLLSLGNAQFSSYKRWISRKLR